MNHLLAQLLEAVSDVLTAGELADGGIFICADEDAQRLQAAYTAYVAATKPADPLVHEYQTLVASLRDEYGPDAELKAQEAFLAVRGDVLRNVHFVPVAEPDYDAWIGEQELAEAARLDALDAEREAEISAREWEGL